MKIESLIRRPDGTTVTLDDATYKFQPDDQGRHVCQVDNAAHAKRLLAIAEGYREVKEPKAAKPAAEPTKESDGGGAGENPDDAAKGKTGTDTQPAKGTGKTPKLK